jgi:hypothetical protein
MFLFFIVAEKKNDLLRCPVHDKSSNFFWSVQPEKGLDLFPAQKARKGRLKLLGQDTVRIAQHIHLERNYIGF